MKYNSTSYVDTFVADPLTGLKDLLDSSPILPTPPLAYNPHLIDSTQEIQNQLLNHHNIASVDPQQHQHAGAVVNGSQRLQISPNGPDAAAYLTYSHGNQGHQGNLPPQNAQLPLANDQTARNNNASVSNPLVTPPFPFHHPFDTHSYPLTNPPLFDYTMKFNYNSNDGQPRRRRISISNGQIGQIINHEAELESDSPLEDLLQPESNPVSIDFPYKGEHHGHGHGIVIAPPVNQPPPSQSQQQQQNLYVGDNSNQDKVPVGSDSPFVEAAGVPPPNHSLIYDNQVIYNPNDGPIPGTAAWKKERLLERNRIAALKCRQRKKQAQQALQKSIQSYQDEVNELKEKVDMYERFILDYKETILSLGRDIPEMSKIIDQLNNLVIKQEN